MEVFYAILLSLISILLVSISWYKIPSRNPQSAPPLPPGPWGLPILGYLPFLRPNLHHQFTELAHQYGPIFSFRLGNRLCVVITSPSLTKEVVRDHDTVFANRDIPVAAQIVTFGGNDIAWSPNNSTWRSLRKLFVREMLSNSSLEASSNLRKDEIRKAIKNVYREIGSPIDVGDLSNSIALNVIMSMLWGGTVEGEEGERVGSEFRRLVPRLVDLMGKPNISDIFPILARFDIQGVKRKMEIEMRSIDRVFDLVIARKIENLSRDEDHKVEGRKDFLQILVEQMEKNDSEMSITRLQLKAILMDIVVGGTDTTSTTIEWVMSELTNNPEAMEKVQKEVSDVIGMSQVVEEFHLPKLPYLLAVVKETMRLHPVAPFLLPKCPSRSTKIGGYTIPKDARVFVNIWSIQRDPSIWENPLEFKPERFLSDANLDFSGNNFHYLPFGSGRRICAGLPLAEKMLMYLLASLLHLFEWKMREGETLDMEETLGIALKKTVPLLLVPTLTVSVAK